MTPTSGKKELYKELKATAIILGNIGIVLLLVFLFQCTHSQTIFVTSLLAYVAAAIVLLHFLGSLTKNKRFNKFISLLSYPWVIIYAILLTLIPFWAILFHVILYFGFAFLIPELIYKVLSHFHLIDFIKEPTTVYLKITLTVFISVLLNPLLRNFVYRISPVRFKTSEKLKPYELKKTTDYFLSMSNVKFFIYGFYVTALLTINYLSFQDVSFGNSDEIDKSILQSFVTFFAFDRATSLTKQLNFKPSELLMKINNSISNKVTSNLADQKK